MSKLQKYPKYKDSGVEWIGEIPEGWEVRKVKYIFYEKSIKNYGSETILAATQTKGVVPKSDLDYKTVEAIVTDLNSFKLVSKNNFVISLRSFEGGIEYSRYKGIISPAYTVLEAIQKINFIYFKHLFKSSIFITALNIHKTGIREGQNISFAKFKEDFLPFPPHDEQIQIANFLDKKTAQIDKLISIKEKLIQKLKEQRQIIINDAVTKGLNPNVKMKDSGIEWIGKIPEHWEVIPNKYIFKIKKNIVGNKSLEYELLSLTLNGVIKRDMENPEGKFPADFNNYQEVKKGDFIFCLFDVEETPRTIGLSDYDGMITGAYTVMESKKKFNKFLYYLYLNLDTNKRMKFLYKGLRNTIPKEVFMSFKIPIPPHDEQIQIANFLDKKTAQIDKAIKLQEEQIKKLKEYKTSLIDSVVTGKVRVSKQKEGVMDV